MAERRRRTGASALGGETNCLGDVWAAPQHHPGEPFERARQRLPLFLRGELAGQSMKSVMASASLSGGMNAIMRTVSIAVPMKTRLVVGPSTFWRLELPTCA